MPAQMIRPGSLFVFDWPAAQVSKAG